MRVGFAKAGMEVEAGPLSGSAAAAHDASFSVQSTLPKGVAFGHSLLPPLPSVQFFNCRSASPSLPHSTTTLKLFVSASFTVQTPLLQGIAFGHSLLPRLLLFALFAWFAVNQISTFCFQFSAFGFLLSAFRFPLRAIRATRGFHGLE